MEPEKQVLEPAQCGSRMVGLNDAMSILSGKWKFHILAALIAMGKLRFTDLQREVFGIGTKMLSKELQDLEMNQLISRTVKNSKPVTVEYEITHQGRTLEDIIIAISTWGIAYRTGIRNTDPHEEV